MRFSTMFSGTRARDDPYFSSRKAHFMIRGSKFHCAVRVVSTFDVSGSEFRNNEVSEGFSFEPACGLSEHFQTCRMM